MTAVLLRPERRWECPNCTLTAVTNGQETNRFHNCRGLRGLSVPMVPAGTRAKVAAHEREDFIGREVVQTDAEGRPVMAVVTTRDDGEDCTVYAPVASVQSQA